MTARRMVYLSLGSNVGRRENNLRAAVRALDCCLQQMRTSSIYETRPMYVEDQPLFLNMVVSGRCGLSARELLSGIQRIEREMGRDREHSLAKGPRIIDIDILLYGDTVIEERQLIVPHPGLTERQFVLIPLLELEPGAVDPRSGRPLSESLEILEEQGVYIFGS